MERVRVFMDFLVQDVSMYLGREPLFSANFPRIVYKLAAEMGWRQSIKANG